LWSGGMSALCSKEAVSFQLFMKEVSLDFTSPVR